MEIKEAIQVLKDHNIWRRYKGFHRDQPEMTDPKKLGIAIDTVVNEFENLFISGVVKPFYCGIENMHQGDRCHKLCERCKKLQ